MQANQRHAVEPAAIGQALVGGQLQTQGQRADGAQLGGGCSTSFWHMARTPALQQALSNAWLKAQVLVSVKDLWCKAQGYTN